MSTAESNVESDREQLLYSVWQLMTQIAVCLCVALVLSRRSNPHALPTSANYKLAFL